MRNRARESRAATHEVSKQRPLYSMPKKPQPLSWRSQFCFPDRLVILSEDRILCRYSRKFQSKCRVFKNFKTLPGYRAYVYGVFNNDIIIDFRSSQ